MLVESKLLATRHPARVWRRLLHAPLARYRAGIAWIASETLDRQLTIGLRMLGGATAIVVATAASLALDHVSGVGGASLLLLLGVLVSAIWFGLAASLFACALSLLSYDFFFIPPFYSFAIAEPEGIVRLVIFAIVAITTSNLMARVRAHSLKAELRAQTTESLYLFSGKLARARTEEEIFAATSEQIASMLNVQVVVLALKDHNVHVAARVPADVALIETDLEIARWVLQQGRPVSSESRAAGGGRCLFLPMQGGHGTVGVIVLERPGRPPLLNNDQDLLLRALCDQASLAAERANLVQDIQQARVEAETDRLKSALLTSISHDLRTPLASIVGCATSLTGDNAVRDPAEQDAMLAIIREEAERLNLFISNLLDMTRLQSGALALSFGLVDLADIVGALLHRARKIVERNPVTVDLEPDLPMLNVDVVLFEQVLFNLLDNGAKYSPAGSKIHIDAARDGDRVNLRVIDGGEGLRPGEAERIFEKFYRSRTDDGRPPGTGLGLAICRGFVEAMQGRITASNRPGRQGAVFTITLPVPEQARIEDEDA